MLMFSEGGLEAQTFNYLIKENYDSYIIDDLNSSDGTMALSANQGKVLKDNIDAIDAKVDNIKGINNLKDGENGSLIGSSVTFSDSMNIAPGENSLSLGFSYAIGNNSFASGTGAYAFGPYSHAEGEYSSLSITVSGEANATTYNINSTSIDKIDGVGQWVRYGSTYAQVTAFDKTNKTVTLSNTLSNTALSNRQIYFLSGATGRGSHAEGHGAHALGDYSHAEGTGTGAFKSYSHAEGYHTKASGHNGSHAEGNTTIASGEASHAEGSNTVASGDYSHAEGYMTEARGAYSHASGYETIATGDTNFVIGKYNIEEEKSYPFIVGNGEKKLVGATMKTVRSNAHTVDWDGNAWFAGNIYMGGTSQDNATLLEPYAPLTPEQIFAIIDNEIIPPEIDPDTGGSLPEPEIPNA